MTVTEVQAENTIPNGKYTFVGIDIDTTGRRILDEVKYYSHRFYYNGFFFITNSRLGHVFTQSGYNKCNIPLFLFHFYF